MAVKAELRGEQRLAGKDFHGQRRAKGRHPFAGLAGTRGQERCAAVGGSRHNGSGFIEPEAHGGSFANRAHPGTGRQHLRQQFELDA